MANAELIEMITSLIAYIAPVVAGSITTIVIPYLIKKRETTKLDSKIEDSCTRMDKASKLLEDRNIELMNELDSIKKTLEIMRGKVPKGGN